MIPNTPFCIEDKFYSDFDSYIDDFMNEESFDNTLELIDFLDDDWEEDCEETNLEKVCTLTEKQIVESIQEHIYNYHEDRFSESGDEDKEIENAIRQSIDIKKLNQLMPQLYYPNGKRFKITKADIVEYLKP